jgi:propionyl-CoA carboxylase alpha chain
LLIFIYRFKLQFVGTIYDVTVLTPKEAELVPFMKEPVLLDTANCVLSPMAGTLVSVAVKEGDFVTYGQELAVVEAMKMQNVLRAQRPGKIIKLNNKVGDTLLVDAVIMEFDKDAEPPSKK